MAIELQDQTRTTYPVLRHQLIGELAQLAIIKTEERDRLARNPATDQLEKIPNGINRDGQPKFKQELVIHAIAMPGTTMEVKQGEEFICPQPGDRVRLILKGLAFGRFLDARKTHRAGKLYVGDLLITGTDQAQVYDATGKPKGEPIRDQQQALKIPRGQTVGYYGPIELAEPTDPQWVNAAEEAFLADQRAEQAARAIPADTTPAASRSYLDEIDF
jgi:hypothetical protein